MQHLAGALQQLLGPSMAVFKIKVPQKATMWTWLSMSLLGERATE